MTAFRKLLAAAAVALTLPLSALAQTAEAPPPLFTIYGTLNVNLQYTKAGDATAGSASDVSGRFAVSSDSSNIGIRGTLDVAHGLKVVYQCETAAALDASTGSLCGRNSRLGLSSAFGTVFYGNWDTPLKAATYGTKADDPFGNTDVFAFQGIMGSPGFNARSGSWTGAATHSFDLRAANSVAYWTPKFSGVTAKAQWSTDETKAANGIVNPTLYGASVAFEQGGLALVGAVELHEDGFGLRSINAGPPAGNTTNESAKDLAWRLSAGYELPLAGLGALTVMGMFEQLKYAQKDAAGANDLEDYSRMAWLLGAKFRTGNHELRARYAQGLNPSCTLADGTDCGDVTDFGAQQFAVGYAYHLAKSAQVFAFYTQIMNEDFAQYTLSIGGSPGAASGTPAGADPMAAGLGMRYAF